MPIAAGKCGTVMRVGGAALLAAPCVAGMVSGVACAALMGAAMVLAFPLLCRGGTGCTPCETVSEKEGRP